MSLMSVPDLNVWPILLWTSLAAILVGALIGFIDLAVGRHTGRSVTASARADRAVPARRLPVHNLNAA